MNEFLLGLTSLTVILNPVMTFILLLTAIMFLFVLKEKANRMEDYIKSIAINLQKISNEMSNRK